MYRVASFVALGAAPARRRVRLAAAAPGPCPTWVRRRDGGRPTMARPPARPRVRSTRSCSRPRPSTSRPTSPTRAPDRAHRRGAADGLRALAHVGKAVSIFGSARTPRDHPEYERARAAARKLGEAGFAIITGGGPGIMEAANRGAKRGRRAVDRPRHRAPARAGLMNHWVDLGADLPLLLHAQGHVRPLRERVRGLPGRLRHARRAVRGRHAAPDRQDPPLPDRARRARLLAGPGRLAARPGARGRQDRAAATSSACRSPTTSTRCSRSSRPPSTGARARALARYSRASSTHSPSRRPRVRAASWPMRKTAWSSSVPGRSMTWTSSSSAGSAPRSAA